MIPDLFSSPQESTPFEPEDIEEIVIPEPEPPAPVPPSAIAEPRLAVFWSAMADARVFALREAFAPLLESCGIPYREFDAENDRAAQLDQVRSAVRDGYNIFAVNLVVDGSVPAAEEIAEAAAGNPVIFFDRTPDDAETAWPPGSNVAVIDVSPTQLGSVQGRMIGAYLAEHFAAADLNRDGQISYTLLAGGAEDPAALALSRSTVEAADAVLTEAGHPPLVFYDPENAACLQADPDEAWSSDAAFTLISSDLTICNLTNGNMIELIIANSDEMALGALTALQASWCNLGDGVSMAIPLFGIGASVPACTAVSLGQLTGTVELNTSGCARAVCDAVKSVAQGEPFSDCFARLARENGMFAVAENAGGRVLWLSPLPYTG